MKAIEPTIRTALSKHIFPFHKLDKGQEERHVAAFMAKLGWFEDQYVDEAVQMASETMAPGRLPVPAQYIGAYRVIAERHGENKREKTEPESPAASRTWCLLEIKRMSPEACREVYEAIERGDPITKLVMNWDSQVLQALAQKAGQAKPREQAPVEEPDSKQPAKPIAEALPLALSAPAPTKEKGWSDF